MKPELFVNWAADSCHLDNIKIKKSIKVLLVRLNGTVTYNINSRHVTTKFSCKDTLFNGRITFEPAEQAVMYRKRFALPMLGNKLGCFVASGRWAFDELSQTWTPSVRFGFEFRHGSAELVRPTTLRLKPCLFLGPVGLQARTLLSLQLPSKMLFDLAPPVAGGGTTGGTLAPAAARDDDSLGINLEVQQLDLVIRV